MSVSNTDHVDGNPHGETAQPVSNPSKNDSGNVDLLGSTKLPEVSPQVDEILAEVAEGSAEPTETQTQTAPPPSDGFDPAIHAVDKKGKPIRTASGGFAKRRGPPKGFRSGAAVTPTTAPANAPAPAIPDAEMRAVAKANAAVVVTLIVAAGVGFGGEEEWTPTKEEREGMLVSWEEYFYISKSPNVPPWVLVVVTTGSYVAVRVRRPNTLTRIQKITGWAHAKWLSFKNRKRLRLAGGGAQNG
jgi:hypothetical protein